MWACVWACVCAGMRLCACMCSKDNTLGRCEPVFCSPSFRTVPFAARRLKFVTLQIHHRRDCGNNSGIVAVPLPLANAEFHLLLSAG